MENWPEGPGLSISVSTMWTHMAVHKKQTTFGGFLQVTLQA